MKKVLVFGTFDEIHPGHENLFQQARELGNHLTVAVSRDKFVAERKGRAPKLNETERLRLVAAHDLVDKAILCDETIGQFKSLQQADPKVIAVGYDQNDLAKELERWMNKIGRTIPIIHLKPYKPELHKTSYVRD
ncbi:MAG: adenylyltransferase/cytidyltransferase family protein [Candidatus Uhrbacteria bacterium]|nr:adenylyltransferase/cytidyltransferase family protein [Patescibacteria group bacterium]MBU1906712.1 adenylyltransferase/cytidyltransferase family protein [Patescibacteria group bacterium]